MEALFYLAVIAAFGLLVALANAAPWTAAAAFLAPRSGRPRARAKIAAAIACLALVELGPSLYGRWRLERFVVTEAQNLGSGRGPSIRSIRIDQEISEAEDSRHFQRTRYVAERRLSKDAPLCGPLCLELLYGENLSAVVVEARPYPRGAAGRPSPRFVRFRRERRRPCPEEPSLSAWYNAAVATRLASGECLVGEPGDAPRVEAEIGSAVDILRRWDEEFGCRGGLALWAVDPSATARIEILEGEGDHRHVAVVRNAVEAFVPSLPFLVWAAECGRASQWLAFVPVTQPTLDVRSMLRERYGFVLAGTIPAAPAPADLRDRVLAILRSTTNRGGMTAADGETVKLVIEEVLRQDHLDPASADLLRRVIRDDAFTGTVPGIEEGFPAKTEFQRAMCGDVLARVLRATEPWRISEYTFTTSLARALDDAPEEVLRAHDAEIRRAMASPLHLGYVAGLVRRIPEFDPDPRGLLESVLLEHQTFSEGPASLELCRLARPDDVELRSAFLRLLTIESPADWTLTDITGLVRAGGLREAEAMAKTEPKLAALMRQIMAGHPGLPGPDAC